MEMIQIVGVEPACTGDQVLANTRRLHSFLTQLPDDAAHVKVTKLSRSPRKTGAPGPLTFAEFLIRPAARLVPFALYPGRRLVAM